MSSHLLDVVKGHGRVGPGSSVQEAGVCHRPPLGAGLRLVHHVTRILASDWPEPETEDELGSSLVNTNSLKYMES